MRESRTLHELRSQDRLGSGSLCRRSIARRCWNVIWDFGVPGRGGLARLDSTPTDASFSAMVCHVDLVGEDVSAPGADASGGIAASETGPASIRRRMRAVTGSSADICFWWMRCGVASISGALRFHRSRTAVPTGWQGLCSSGLANVCDL